MPWTLTPQGQLLLKNQVKIKFPQCNSAGVDLLVAELLQAKNKKQAEAVLSAVTEFTDIRKLREYGFEKLTNNSPATIKAALEPDVLQKAAQERRETELQNDKLNGYLPTVTSRAFHAYRNQHTIPALPIEDHVGNRRTVIARRYHNLEGKLPQAAHYIEWYPLAGGLRSSHKRFFTARGNPRVIWYTEGGTHDANTAEWWKKTSTSDDWISF